jgi:hypothetical protein
MDSGDSGEVASGRKARLALSTQKTDGRYCFSKTKTPETGLYGGTFTFDGSTVTHHVDISYNQTWTGTDLTRQAKFENSRLILTTPPAISNVDGKTTFSVLTWEKVK